MPIHVHNFYTHGEIIFVSPHGDDGNNGSFYFPFRTIQAAIDDGTAVIQMLPGSYRESVTIHNRTFGLLIEGYGASDSHSVEWIADDTNCLTITGTTTRVRMKDIQLDGDGVHSCVSDSSTGGRHKFGNVTFYNSGSEPVIHRAGAERWFELFDCFVDGEVLLDGSTTDGSFTIRHSVNTINCTITNDGYDVLISYVNAMGPVSFEGGTFTAAYVLGWLPDGSGNIITADAGTSVSDVINVGFSNYSADGLTYGTIQNNGSATVVEFSNKTS